MLTYLTMCTRADEMHTVTLNFICFHVLIDFLLTVKAATLIFISGRGSAISSAKEGNQVLFIIW